MASAGSGRRSTSLAVGVSCFFVLAGAASDLAHAGQRPLTPAGTFTVRPDHPRLFVTPERLPLLRHFYGIAGYEGVGSNFGALSVSYQYLRGKAVTHISQGRSGLLYLANYSFFTMIEEGDTLFLNAAKRSADEIVAAWGGGTPQDEGDLFGRAPDMALFFDWTYNQLTQGERDTYAPYLVDGTQSYIGDPRSKGENLPWQPVSHYNAYPFAIHGEGYADSLAQAGANEVYHWFTTAFVPVMDEIYGGALVRGYAGIRVSAMVFTAELLLTATGQDFYVQSEFLQNAGMAVLSRSRNDGQTADATGKYNVGEANPELLSSLLAARYSDGGIQTFANHFAANPSSYFGSESRQTQNILLFHDPRVAATPLDGMPLSWNGQNGGNVYLRNAWRLYTETFESDIHAGFFNGPHLVSGEIGAQNHFVIGRGDDALIIHGADFEESDAYHWFGNWFGKTISHNGLLVYDPAETFGTYGGIALDNDGGASVDGDEAMGDAAYPEANRPGTAGVPYRGRVSRFEDTGSGLGGYAYVRGSDAHLGYTPGKLTEWTRDFLYYRPDLFFVFDRVEASDPTWPKSVVFHTVSAPVLDGAESQLEGSAFGGIYESTNSSTFRADRGTSRIFVRTILPADPIHHRIGGGNASGLGMRQSQKPFATVTYDAAHSYEWYYAGRNNCPSPDLSGQSTLYTITHRDGRNDHPVNPAGDWRVEVESDSVTSRDYFLHVLWPTAQSSAEMPLTALVESREENASAVRIDSLLVAFAHTDGVTAATFPSLPSGTYRLLFSGLAPGAGFDALPPGAGDSLVIVPGSNYYASSGGVLSLDFVISLVPDTDPPDGVDDLAASPAGTSGAIVLQWTATGDDGSTGTAAAYLVRSAADSITEATWAAATVVPGAPPPDVAGTPQTFQVNGLTPGQEYWFAVRAVDDGLNVSPVAGSASAVATDLLAPLSTYVGFLQNPILPAYLQIIVIVSRSVVDSTVTVRIGSDTLFAEPNDVELGKYRAAYKLGAPGVVSFEACATTSSGDSACFTRVADLEFIRPGPGGRVRSPDGAATFTIGPGALTRDEWVILSAARRTSLENWAPDASFDQVVRAYDAGPRWARMEDDAELRVRVEPSELLGLPLENAAIEVEDGGAWRSLPTFADQATGELVAYAPFIANFRVGLSMSRPLSQVLPRSVVLEPNAPNPFLPGTTIRYLLPRREMVDLAVYDVAGRLVTRLMDGMQGPGAGTVMWDGRDARGADVAPGVYIYRLRAGDEAVARKMVLVK